MSVDSIYQTGASPVRFAAIVFVTAGVWGMVLLMAPYLLVDVGGRQAAAPAEYGQGVLSATMAWQMAILVIASDPQRHRLLMIPAIVEKLVHVLATAVSCGRAHLPASDAIAAGPDLILAVLFIGAFVWTRPPRVVRGLHVEHGPFTR